MNEIFSAIYARLNDQVSVPCLDYVEKDYSTFPYVRIDPLQLTNGDTDNETGFDGTIQIIGFSRYKGAKEINELHQEIYNALHRWAMPDTASYGVSGVTQEFSTIATESDGVTKQSIQRFRILFESLPV